MRKKKRKRRRPFDERRRKLFKLLCSGMGYTEAANKAGYSSRHAAYRAFRDMRETVSFSLDEKGMSVPALITKYLQPLLEAQETKFFQFQGEVTQQINVAALDTRATALDVALKLHGAYAPREVTGKDGKPLLGDGIKVIDVSGMPRHGSVRTP